MGPAAFFCSFGKYWPRSYCTLGTGLELGLSKTQTGEASPLLRLTCYGGGYPVTAQLALRVAVRKGPAPGWGPREPESTGVPGHCDWMLAWVAVGSLSRDSKVMAGTQGGAGWPSWADQYLWVQLRRGEIPPNTQAELMRTACPTGKHGKVG